MLSSTLYTVYTVIIKHEISTPEVMLRDRSQLVVPTLTEDQPCLRSRLWFE
jgi:hypothetical protein